MPTYAIGDVQGCFQSLQKLLEKIQFNPDTDTLWFTGDLVNRGPQSLEVLRFIKNLGDKHRVVLGNHDLHLLGAACGVHPTLTEDSFADILLAEDKDELIEWLCHLPLLHEELGYVMTHAGLAPMWDLPTAKRLAKEVETVLQGEQRATFLREMYGNEPALWQESLRGWDRLRCITNYFTRMRFCDRSGGLELKTKGKITEKSQEKIPWFLLPNRVNADIKIIFGHWAALSGITDTPNTYALDTGCVWGYCLTAMRLEDEERLSQAC